MWITTWSNPAPGMWPWRPDSRACAGAQLADRGPAGGEALVAGVLGLAEEGLEAAQPVGRAVTGSGVGHLELEVLAEVAQPAEHGGLAQPGVRAELGDLPGGQEAGPGAQHPEHGIVHVRILRRGLAAPVARVLERPPDGRTQRLRHRRREGVADLPVACGLAA